MKDLFTQVELLINKIKFQWVRRAYFFGILTVCQIFAVFKFFSNDIMWRKIHRINDWNGSLQHIQSVLNMFGSKKDTSLNLFLKKQTTISKIFCHSKNKKVTTFLEINVTFDICASASSVALVKTSPIFSTGCFPLRLPVGSLFSTYPPVGMHLSLHSSVGGSSLIGSSVSSIVLGWFMVPYCFNSSISGIQFK